MACAGEWGKQLGDGLFEFRTRHTAEEVVALFTEHKPRPASGEARITLRVFCHAHGNKLILLLGGYDKAEDPSNRKQDTEIKAARKRLREYRSRDAGS